MTRKGNSYESKKTAMHVLKTLFTPEDLKEFEFLKVIILSGLPGSGKSTITKLLKTRYGFERLSTDQIRTEELFPDQGHRLGKDDEYQKMVMASRYFVYEELSRRLGKALTQGKKIVVDGTNMDNKRLMVLGSALSHVAVEQVAFVVLKPPESIVRKRLLEEGEAEVSQWCSVYKYWRKYMKEGSASYPSDATFPRIRKIVVKKY